MPDPPPGAVPATRDGLRQIAVLARQWWNDPVDHLWSRAFLHARSLTTAVRLTISAFAAMLALSAIAVMWSPSGPGSGPIRIANITCALLAVFWMLRWILRPWPNQRTSVTFVLSADAGICLASTLDADPMAGLCGVLMLLVPGLYVTFFHGPALVVAHVAICLIAVVVVLMPVALGPDADPALTVAKGATAVMVLLVIPAMTHIGLWLLRADAAASLVDPLTGLLNRRGFTTQMSRLMVAAQASVSTQHLAVAVYDLDNFKTVNDTFGHDAGDLVLRTATQCVDQQLPLSAIHARLGGEEFAVAAVKPPAEVRALAEAIRLAVQIADGPTAVTASVGVTSTPIGEIDSTDLEVHVIEWLRDADRAMYRSKRSGGNAVGVDE